MNHPEPPPPPGRASGGLLSALADTLGALGGLLLGRFELLLLDLQDGVDCLGRVLLLGLISLMAASLGLLVGALALIFAFWETHRLLVSLLVVGGFFLLALLAALAARSQLSAQRALFSASLEEFARDRELFRHRP
ncbi:MAG TPA: phage holin family protein [Steroidobacteraceae bacterium]|nr:phage holin family protein [Steroidobacteraceae bacterium]